MINAQELRIGNWVDYNNAYYNIWCIDKDFIELDSEKSDSHLHNIQIISINPIHLTHELLVKCGFIRNRNNELSIECGDIANHLELMEGKDNYYYPSFTQTPQGDEERTVYFNRINSVHQLQNLIFALTQNELPITL